LRLVLAGSAALAAVLVLPVAAIAQDADPDATLSAGELPVPQVPATEELPEVEPVIEDGEFNELVPDLDVEDDPELDGPLESIEAFERRLAAEQADADADDGQAAPLGDAALADGDPVEAIGDAPIRDAELTKPLPALESFEVEAVEFAEEAADPDMENVAYRIELNGIDEIEAETPVSLRGMFRSLSALRDGDGEAANTAMIASRLEEDSQLILTILAAEGWYSATAQTRVQFGEENSEPVLAVIDVTPGQRYNIGEILIDAQATTPPGLIRDNLALELGEPIVAERVQGAEARVAVALPENGYPFAEIGQRDILLDRDTGTGVYTLPVDTGPRARFGGFRTTGKTAFDADHVEVLARFERGEIYDASRVDDLRKALVATGLFGAISVKPERSGESADDGTEYVTMVVDQQKGPPRTIAGSVGYGTGQGFRLEGTWTHRNMFPPEGALIAHGVAGTSEQGAGVTFRRSNAGKRDRTFEVIAEVLHADYDAYNAYTGRIAAQVRRESTPIWQKRITYAYGAEMLATVEKDWDFDAQQRRSRTYYVGALNGEIGIDTSDDLLDPTKGFRINALFEPEAAFDGGFNPYVRMRLDGSTYFSASDALIIAGRVRLGSIQGADRADIPPSRRFYSGGGGSVRGFAYQGLGPTDGNDNPLGARSLNEASVEARYRFGNFGVVGFVDAGQSYVETMPQFSDLRFGAGIGVRYYTNFGPLRVDVATPIGRRPGESRINVYVSIGQAF
jgi:translocation and assembly module TamA